MSTPPAPTLRDWLGEEPFSLALSAGFFGFFAHAGALAALLEGGVEPSRLAGSSAGALVAGLWASGMEPGEMKAELLSLRREDFWDPAPGLGLLRGDLFDARLRGYLRARTFGGCRAPLSVSVFDLSQRATRVIHDGRLAPAIRASCSFPGLFHPVRMHGRRFLDGGVADRSGLAGVPTGGRVLYHHLATRSRVRRRFERWRSVPARVGLVPVVVAGLPGVGPFHLDRGRRAYEIARAAFARALEQRIPVTRDAPLRVGEV